MDIASKHKKRLFAVDICSIVLVFALMWVLNSMLPYISDDMHFKFIWIKFEVSEGDGLVTNLKDILISIKNYYSLSGGRALLHFLCYLFVYLPKWIFNILNSAMFVLLGIVIRRLVTVNIKERPLFLLPCIYLICLIYMPYFGDNCVWLSGAINYLWSGVLLLFCCYLIIKYIPTAGKKTMALCAIPIIISSLCNETTGGMLLLLSLFVLIPQRAALKRYIYCFFCTVPWLLTVVLAKGNFARADLFGINIYATDSISDTISLYCRYSTGILEANPPIFVLLLFMIYTVYVKRRDYMGILRDNGLIFCGLAGVFALCLTGFYSNRPIMLGYIVYLSGFLKLTLEALYKKQIDIKGFFSKDFKYYKLFKCLCAVILVGTAFFVAFTLGDCFSKYCHDIKNLEYCYGQYADLKSDTLPVEFLSEEDDWFPPTTWNFALGSNSPFIGWYQEYCRQTGKTGLEEFYIKPN